MRRNIIQHTVPNDKEDKISRQGQYINYYKYILYVKESRRKYEHVKERHGGNEKKTQIQVLEIKEINV